MPCKVQATYAMTYSYSCTQTCSSHGYTLDPTHSLPYSIDPSPTCESLSAIQYSHSWPQVSHKSNKCRRRHKFVRESKDPAKMAYSRMTLSKRGWGAKPVSSNSHAVAQCAGCRYRCRPAHRSGSRVRAWQRTSSSDTVAEELEEVGIHTLGARTRAVQL